MYSLFATIPQALGNRKTTITNSSVRANHHGETTLPTSSAQLPDSQSNMRQ